MKKNFSKFPDKLYAQSYYEQTVVIYSDREAIIENVRRVLEANEICIRLLTHLGEAAIWGEQLYICSYKGTTIKINGKISSCEIERRNKLA